MASKWREFECDVLGNVLFNGYNPEGKNIERIVVVERAALAEALELIGELEAVVESIAAEKCKPNFDDVLPNLERGKLISIIDVDTDIARKALARIKAFKDRMNESTTTEIKGES